MSLSVVRTERLNTFSASEIRLLVAAGAVSAERIVRACLERIAEREPAVRAWAFVDPERAIAEAQERDRSGPAGPLRGVPVGIKDIIDTADMPTEMGSPIYAGHQPAADAACVAIVRAAGAIVLGKTVTAEFAGSHPGATANPHDPGRTPGGSSSGSAAAVADRMVPVAFGTQTGGSVLRPSSFCGIIGFKPSFGTFNRAGIKFAAESLDTIGLHARTLEDIALVRDVLVGRPPAGLPARKAAPRIGLCRTPLWETAEPATADAVESAAGALAAAGATVREVALPRGFAGLGAARAAINDYERARAMAHEWRTARDRLSPRMAETVRKGLAVPYADYLAALRMVEGCRARLGAVLEGWDALLAPCVTGEAPSGLDYAGDPALQALWTLLHVPAITLPSHTGPSGLPVGIQLVARRGEDDGLLAVAGWAWERLGIAVGAPA